MEKAMIIRTDKVFQEKALNDAVKGLAKAYTNIEKNKKDACLILWRLEDGKKYEKDGFKSLADFAESIGIDKSSAHRMADAGRVYDSKIPAIAQFADEAGYTAASKVASMVKNEGQEKALASAIESGELSSNMTVDSIGNWKADKIAEITPEKILPKYKVDGMVYTVPNAQSFQYDSIEIEMIPEIIGFERVGTFDMRVNENDSVKWLVYASPMSGTLARFTAEKVKKEKKSVKSVKSIKNMSLEELEAELARRKAELQ